MKIIQGLQQGSVEWLQFRATRFGSSEAGAMLGLSPHMTRSELLRMKHTGLAREFGDWFQRHVLDKGHAIEAATRPLIEDQIGEMLYPVIVQGPGRLVGSCDGLSLEGDLVWECKQWAKALASEVDAGHVPDTHMPQCQHLLLVTGASRLLFTVSDGAGNRVSADVYPDREWFERLGDGWSRFEQDLAAYVPPATAEPDPVGRAPATLPALRIEVTGAVTASNLAEFKATALAAIRGVNKTLATDSDFADADKAVKWCGDVEARLNAAKEHALSQTADIDALFKALEDIGAEARAVRLNLEKLVARRKTEVKEQAVLAARRALDLHIEAANAELAPMRLLPVVFDFAGAIKGLRSIDSMQNALDTTLAGAKIAADSQARGIRANLAAFKAATGGLEFLFSDLGSAIHKSADDFSTMLQARIAAHRAAESAREAKRQADDAALEDKRQADVVARIAAAEQRAREQEAARIAAQQAEDAQVAAAALSAASLLAQDLNAGLSGALAADPAAPLHAREAAAAIGEPLQYPPMTPTYATPGGDRGPSLKAWRQALGFDYASHEPVAVAAAVDKESLTTAPPRSDEPAGLDNDDLLLRLSLLAALMGDSRPRATVRDAITRIEQLTTEVAALRAELAVLKG